MNTGNNRHQSGNRRGRYSSRPKVNNGIKYQYNQIKVIDEDETMLGLMDSTEALLLARKKGLDLVEVTSNVVPPICKILDYGKHKYKIQKQANLNRKNQKVVVLKEIKLHANVGIGDYNVKLKKARELLEDGCKLKVSVRLRGREMMHKNVAINLLKRVVEDLSEIAKLEKDTTQSNNQFILILASSAKPKSK